MNKYSYLLAYIIPVSTYVSLSSHGVLTFMAPIVAFIIIPLIELVIPIDPTNLSETQEKHASKSKFYDGLLYSMLPIQYLLLIYFSIQISEASFNHFEAIGLIFSMGISCGVIGINVAHELGHRQKKSEQLMAKLLLATSWYTHFFVEHNKGHHRYVSTPEDPASAQLNQSLFNFWWVSIIGSFKSALKLDQLVVLKWKLFELSLTVMISLFWGVKAGVFVILAAVVGILLLESVNYIEHYGLVRKLNPSRRFEKVTPAHSWNSDHPLGRLVLFNLSRHSDHHANANKKYQLLKTYLDQSPQFPTGYSGMILLSLIPPLWFRIMNKRIKGAMDA